MAARKVKDLIATSAPPAPRNGVGKRLSDPTVRQQRANYGGALTGPALTPILLYHADLDSARVAADAGRLGEAARLYASARVDGVIQGLMSTRTSGLCRLQLRWSGDAEAVAQLKQGVSGGTAIDDPTSLFDYCVPRQELSRFAEDGVALGVAIGSLEPGPSGLPLFQRLDPGPLRYEYYSNTWSYDSMQGPLLVQPGVTVGPGESKFVFYTAGRQAPWLRGLWAALVRCFITKDHARALKSAWEQKLANPGLLAQTPAGASDDEAGDWFDGVAAWGNNTVLQGPPGYSVDILESNGIGAKSFDTTIEAQDREISIVIAGQTVSSGDGATGFVNGALFKSIRADLIQSDAAWLAEVINFQILPALVEALYPGEDRVAVVHFDALPPAELNQQASAYVQAAAAIKGLTEAFTAAGQGQQLDISAVCQAYSIPLLAVTDELDDIEATAELVPELAALPENTAVEPAQLAPDAGVPEAAPTTDVQKLSLNGAQVASMLQIIDSCATGQIPRSTALQILKAAFQMDEDTADELLGDVGRGFQPAAAEPAAAATAPEPAAAPAPEPAVTTPKRRRVSARRGTV